ncbi:hypothetical protein BN946_scf184985.g58 [Trametes cinnabarina]|uniref:Uncharacterized protein n=1 Tax=Pycnoporus cinnabarinus TaxID=5643 RepID=A0A060SK70_PYCCI|nr:hypothetical protein BN946_scf184985.g58 [Trametes cinnabarina]
MNGVSADPQLTGEFANFLNAQLKECREQLRRITEENILLKAQVDAIELRQPSVVESDVQESIENLEAELEELKNELSVAREEAEIKAQEATTWRMRCEAAQSSTAERQVDLKRTAAKDELFVNMRSHVNSVDVGNDRVVFDLPKLQILPKAAQSACEGGFGFYGDLLRWCSAPSQNALLLCPDYTYTPGLGMEATQQWSHATDWTALAGTRHELFDTDGERLVYAGTFLFHKGPVRFDLRELQPAAGGPLIDQLAQHTFNPSSKTQRAKGKTYLPVLRELYEKGEATIQVLGLQRVGFNTRFFNILRKAYLRRGKMRARARSETVRSSSPKAMTLLEMFGGGASTSQKRLREDTEAERAGGDDPERVLKQQRTSDDDSS